MSKLVPSLIVGMTFLSAPALAADFEGVLEMKMTTRIGGGTMRVSIGKPGVRNELTLSDPRFPTKITVGSSRVDLQACKLEYSIVSPK